MAVSRPTNKILHRSAERRTVIPPHIKRQNSKCNDEKLVEPKMHTNPSTC